MKNNTQRAYLQTIAKKLRDAISGGVSEEKQEIIGEILISLANQSNFGIDDAELIEISFPLMIERLNDGYATAIIHCLEAVLDSSVEIAESDVLDAEVVQ